MSKRVLEILKSKFGADIYETHSQFGDDTAVVNPEKWREIARFLRDDSQCAMNMFVDLTAVDYLGRQTPRFEVVLHLRSLERGHRIRLKARIGDDDANGVEIDSVVPVWKGANWFERECFDMFGVNFKGHPDLRRILMYPEFVGYPLRKDYPADKTQPLVELRNVPDKLPPFGIDEGMPFGRQTHDYPRGEETN
ncbi:NADH-quinone oxidoreductase subunit C [Polyangium sp. 15x6]|uniref:NADH-quinone oxidoreductase subunit C n=1 Tax=Polyangium sp. 15x6 TaxID=3042687 RepID=UPI00249A0D83|nr:NADH-quinone oxidoreductase subunit C [Polyangium sp. 15x6]MDI3283666.1 NADH-quinone oxidoreductase subunit C [Polyangium sp. 15x6]